MKRHWILWSVSLVVAICGSLVLSGCDGYCSDIHSPSIFCPDNPKTGTVGGTGGGAGGGVPTACDPCNDGQGNTLQNVGQPCGNAASGAYCCAGLVCAGYGDTYMGTCVGTPQCSQSWVPLTTTKLRSIAIANNINGCANQTGITQSRTIGVAFETWALKTMGQLPRWTQTIASPRRKAKNNNGLPASVIPEYVDSQVTFTFQSPLNLTWTYFPNSMFYEVKAVTGNLTLGTSQWQIQGLLDVATIFPTVPAGKHAPPVVIFTTTSNTIVSQGVLDEANNLGVGVWQQKVFYDGNSATPNNPLLHLGKADCLTPSLYPTTSLVSLYWLDPGAPWPDNPLTWPTVPEQNSVVVPGDPDPAEVD